MGEPIHCRGQPLDRRGYPSDHQPAQKRTQSRRHGECGIDQAFGRSINGGAAVGGGLAILDVQIGVLDQCCAGPAELITRFGIIDQNGGFVVVAMGQIDHFGRDRDIAFPFLIELTDQGLGRAAADDHRVIGFAGRGDVLRRVVDVGLHLVEFVGIVGCHHQVTALAYPIGVNRDEQRAHLPGTGQEIVSYLLGTAIDRIQPIKRQKPQRNDDDEHQDEAEGDFGPDGQVVKFPHFIPVRWDGQRSHDTPPTINAFNSNESLDGLKNRKAHRAAIEKRTETRLSRRRGVCDQRQSKVMTLGLLPSPSGRRWAVRL
jgi:hypothetical protein